MQSSHHHHHHVLHHHECPGSPEPPYSSTNTTSEPVYMPLNNFDNIRSYTPSPKHDQLDNISSGHHNHHNHHYPRHHEFVHNITKPSNSSHHNTLPPTHSCGSSPVNYKLDGAGVSGSGGVYGGRSGSGGGSVRTLPPGMLPPDHHHHQLRYRDNLGHNLKESYYDGGKISNG